MCTIELQSSDESEAFAGLLTPLLSPPVSMAFRGELGMGKTTLIRAILRSAGIVGAIKSPSFGILEHYEAGARQWVHIDCYRLADFEELEFVGLRDYLSEDSVLLVEWPEKMLAAGFPFDIECFLSQQGAGRLLKLVPHSDKGANIISMLKPSEGTR